MEGGGFSHHTSNLVWVLCNSCLLQEGRCYWIKVSDSDQYCSGSKVLLFNPISCLIFSSNNLLVSTMGTLTSQCPYSVCPLLSNLKAKLGAPINHISWCCMFACVNVISCSNLVMLTTKTSHGIWCVYVCVNRPLTWGKLQQVWSVHSGKPSLTV